MKNYIKTIIILLYFALVLVGCKKKEPVETTEPTTVTDIDGNVYKIVKIGTQYWMSENLKTTCFRNGDSVPTTYPSNLQTPYTTTAKYQWTTGLDNKYLAEYGRVYTQGAVEDARGLAPIGWHIPSEAEFQQLIDFVGGNLEEIGYKLKDKNSKYWEQTSTSHLITNSSGFSARAGGSRYNVGIYVELGSQTQFATTAAVPGNFSKGLNLTGFNNKVGLLGWSPGEAIHVRCVKD